MLPTQTDVLIVGAGPTGLTLAIALRQAGVDHLLIDRLPKGRTPRGPPSSTPTRSRCWPRSASTDRSRARPEADRFTIRDRDRALLPTPLRRHCRRRNDYILMIPQDVTERVLADRLAALGGTIHRGVTATAATQDDDGARVTVASPDGAQTHRGPLRGRRRRHAQPGAQGRRHRLRRRRPHEGSFVLADVRMDWSLGRDEVSLFFAARRHGGRAPLPDGAFRHRRRASTTHPSTRAPRDIQALIDSRGPLAPNRVEEVIWSSRFRHPPPASPGSYRAGRVLLMGDAAHVHSPAGGQGMNTGIVDAVVLGRDPRGGGARARSSDAGARRLRRRMRRARRAGGPGAGRASDQPRA